MLNITLSNRFEVLLEELLKELEKPQTSVFSVEPVIVPSSAVKRKLTLAIADRFGICANQTFPFLAQWLWQQISLLIPVSDTSPFSPQILSWRVFRILGDTVFVQAHPRLAAYLAKCDEVMRYDLACHIATTLEQYVTYRPDWLAIWSRHERIPLGSLDESKRDLFHTDEEWQAALWQRIVDEIGIGNQHPADLFFETLTAHTEKAVEILPERIHLFCQSAIAPQYIRMLNHLSRWVDIQMYVMNPCREYWFDVVDARRLGYLAKRGKAVYHESGNRLLPSWGKQTQAFLDLLFDQTSFGNTEESLFISNAEEGKPATLLAQLQDAILDLRELDPHSISSGGDDRSLEVHVCHSLTREIEVLQDQLLMVFAGPHPPLPEDILVVTPDLEQAAPLIEAVFSNASTSNRIPYLITGRASSKINLLARALLDLLALASSRFSANDVFNLLLQPPIAHRFGLAHQLDATHEWLHVSGISWGLDGEHKQEFNLPAVDAHSFHDGFHRLFLAYALPADARFHFENVLPVGNPEGKNAESLGSLWHFIQKLRALRSDLSQPKSAEDWMQTLLDALDTFMVTEEDQIEDDLELRKQIKELYKNLNQGCDEYPVSLEVIRRALTQIMDGTVRGGIPSGMVTVSSMSSLRQLAFKHIYIIGLNSGVFPDASKPVEFDLLSIAPRRGDRQRRDDDRNTFLDLLLSARDRLYLSYTGRSVRDNSLRPPSVLISELLDYLLPVIAVDASPQALKEARDSLVLEHPLQSFSVQYFNGSGDPRLVSCNEEFCNALIQKQMQPTAYIAESLGLSDEDNEEDNEEEVSEAKTLFFREALPEPDEEWRDVTLSQLIRFFSNPSRFLLQQRMGIAFADVHEELAEHEPFLPTRRGSAALASRLLPLYLGGHSQADIIQYARAGNEYPSGQLGNTLLEVELNEIRQFAESLTGDMAAPQVEPFSHRFEFRFPDQAWTLTGTLNDLRSIGLVRYRYGNIRSRDYLSGWIEHLFMNAAFPYGVEDKRTTAYFRDTKYTINPVDGAEEILENLLHLYRLGLEKPLNFFPASAMEYIKNNESMKKAMSTWKNTHRDEWGEGSDSFYRLALRGQGNPLDDSFIEYAKMVITPLLHHMEEEKK